MQTSESSLPFSHNLFYKPLRFDDKLDLIEVFVSVDEKTCLMIDHSWNYHIKSYSPEDEEYVSRQFPLPSYANNRNPNVLYSVDYGDLYRYLNPHDYTYHFAEEKMDYAQIMYRGDYKIGIQFDSVSPVFMIDLRSPENPVRLQDVFGVECLIIVGSCCLAWYERRSDLVFLYHEKLQKRKILNFAKGKIEELHSLKDHVIIAVSKHNLEILDYSKNKIIKSVCFLNEEIEPTVVIHSEGNIISYINEGSIYVCKTEKGKIKWESQYELNEYNSQHPIYAFISHNLIAFNMRGTIHILYVDSRNFSLHTIIQHPWLGFVDSPDLTIACCERAHKQGIIVVCDSIGSNRFAVVECVCRELFWHGHQRVSIFSLENLKSEDLSNPHYANVHSITFTLRKSILFEEYRDSVRVIDILDETLAMFITERGKIFQVNLKENLVKYALELPDLVRKKSGEFIKIEKFFTLAQNRVAIVTKKESSRYARIAIFSFEKRSIEWDSADYEEEGENHIVFYDVIKLNANKLFLTFKMEGDNLASSVLGEISREDEVEEGKFTFYNYDLSELATASTYDRLWDLEGSLIAMRHAVNVFYLSFLNPHEETLRIKRRFLTEKHLAIANVQAEGILDVKFIKKDVVCIQLKMKTLELVVLVYNLRTEELLNKITTCFDVIGTIRQCYRENDRFRGMERMVVFGFNNVENGLNFQSVQDVMNKKINSISSKKFFPSLRISSSNFRPLFLREDQALIYENDCHKNFICLLKSPNFKLECLRVLQKAVSNKYHNYIYKDIVDTIFGVKV